ncbi:MAG: preprotein translocase subunit YajC [bacterium]
MSLLNTVVLGMGTPPAGQGQGQGSGMLMMGYMAIIFALFYFMMIRPQMKREKERKKLIENIKAGDRILFCGGLLGVVASVKDNAFVVKIAENVKIEIARGAVLRVLDKDEAPGEIENK